MLDTGSFEAKIVELDNQVKFQTHVDRLNTLLNAMNACITDGNFQGLVDPKTPDWCTIIFKKAGKTYPTYHLTFDSDTGVWFLDPVTSGNSIDLSQTDNEVADELYRTKVIKLAEEVRAPRELIIGIG
jgi:hypothetical protein